MNNEIKVGDKVRFGEVGKPMQSGTVVEICGYGYVVIAECGDAHLLREEELSRDNFGEINIPVKVDLDDTYWQAYAADLAKEIVLKLIGKNNDEKMLAEYAVNVAKSVVENLKKK